MRRRTHVLPVIAVFILLAGCNDIVARLAKVSGGAAQVTKAFQQAEITLHQQGLVSNEEHVALQRALIPVAEAGVALDGALRNQPTNAKVLTAVSAALTAVDKLNTDGILRIKNAQAQQTLSLALQSIKSLLLTFQAALGG